MDAVILRDGTKSHERCNAKIAAAVPEGLRPYAEPARAVPQRRSAMADGIDIAQTRAWIDASRKIRITFRRRTGRAR